MTMLGKNRLWMKLNALERSIIVLKAEAQAHDFAIIGGRGTLLGPLVGAALITVAAELFRNVFAEANLLIYGALIVIVVLFAPSGILGEVHRWTVRRRYARGARG